MFLPKALPCIITGHIETYLSLTDLFSSPFPLIFKLFPSVTLILSTIFFFFFLSLSCPKLPSHCTKNHKDFQQGQPCPKQCIWYHLKGSNPLRYKSETEYGSACIVCNTTKKRYNGMATSLLLSAWWSPTLSPPVRLLEMYMLSLHLLGSELRAQTGSLLQRDSLLWILEYTEKVQGWIKKENHELRLEPFSNIIKGDRAYTKYAGGKKEKKRKDTHTISAHAKMKKANQPCSYRPKS